MTTYKQLEDLDEELVWLDRFAAAALTGLAPLQSLTPGDVADAAYTLAESMLKIRRRSHEAAEALAEGREPEGVVDLREDQVETICAGCGRIVPVDEAVATPERPVIGPWCRECVPGEEGEDDGPVRALNVDFDDCLILVAAIRTLQEIGSMGPVADEKVNVLYRRVLDVTEPLGKGRE